METTSATPTSPLDNARVWRKLLVGIAYDGLVELQNMTHDQRLGGGVGGDIRTSQNHPGAKGIREDAELDVFFEAQLAAYGRDSVLYYGEERPAPGVVNWRPKLKIIESDPLDGSTPKLHKNSGFAIVLTAWEVAADGFLYHLGGVILNGDGTCVSWCRPDGIVYVDMPSLGPGVPPRHYELDRGKIVPGDPQVLACVGARHDQLKKITALDAAVCEELEVTVYNEAGNPSIPHLLLHQLGGVYELKSPTAWDAAFLIPLQLAGGVVYDLEGNRRDVIAEFEQLTELSPDTRRIPPFIAVSHPDALGTAMAVLRTREG